MQRRCLLFVIIGGLVSQLSCRTKVKQVDFSTAKSAYAKYDFRTALSGFRSAAEQGNPDAPLLLAKMYENGEGSPQNYLEALKWYNVAAQKRDAIAENSIGKLYDEGNGVPKDQTEALKWFRLASEHGNGDASFTLGDKYYRGIGVQRDRYEAVKLGVLSA